MMKVLIVEDDSQIAKSLGMSLTYSGYEVAIADNLALAWLKISQHPYDIGPSR